MTSNYSAFDVSKIISILRRRNISVSFEEVEQLYRAFDDIFPILLESKAESKKFFEPRAQITYYNCDNSEIVKLANYNPYYDAGMLFEERDKVNMQHIINFLNYFDSLQNLYFIDAPNVFGTHFTADMEHVLHTEYNLNYVNMNIFTESDLKQFVAYMPKFLEFCQDDGMNIKSSNVGIISVVVTPDHKPKKFNFSIPAQNVSRLIGNKEKEIESIIKILNIDSMVKIGFYFIGSDQNKLSIQFNDVEKIIEDLNITEELKETIKYKKDCGIAYELIWNGDSIEERNLLLYEEN
jgi:hypothetical protein